MPCQATTSSGQWLAVCTLTGLLFAVVPVVSDYAQVGRSYGLDFALVMAASLAFLWAADPPAARASSRWHRWRRWIVYGCLVAIAGYMHELTFLAVLAHGVTLLWSRVDRSTLRRWATAAVGAALLMVPILLISHAEDSAVAWINFRGWADVGALIADLFGPSGWAIGVTLCLIAVALLPRTRAEREPGATEREPLIAERAQQRRVSRFGIVRFALPLLVLPAGLLFIESAAATPLYGGTRYVLFSVAGAVLLSAAGLDRIRRFVAGRSGHVVLGWVACAAVIVALLLLGLPTQISQRTTAGRPEDEHAASAFIAGRAQKGDAVLFSPTASSLAALGYPEDYTQVDRIALRVSPESSGEFYGISRSLGEIERSILAHDRVWEVANSGSTGLSGFQLSERRLLAEHFRVETYRAFTGVTVRLWVKPN